MAAEPDDEMVPQGLTAPDDCFFLDAFNRSYEGSVARLNESLARLVTLSTAMAGGALVLLKEDICYGWWRVAAAGLFFAALGVAVWGSVPVAAEMRFEPNSVRDQLARSAHLKRRWVRASSVCLLAGLLAAIAGAACRVGFGGPGVPPPQDVRPAVAVSPAS